jgi:excisionase family DNA binding protein
MATFSLREAAEQTQTSKSTIFRAIKAGRLSAARDDDGNFAIDPAELFRVYPPKTAATVPAQPEKRPEGQDAPASETSDATELRIRNAQLEAQVNALREILEMEKQRAAREIARAEELKAERDRWAAALEASQRQITHLTDKATSQEERRGWWPWRRSA